MLERLRRLAGPDVWNLLVPFLGAALSILTYFQSNGGWPFYASLILTVLTYLTSEKLSRLTFEGEMRSHFRKTQLVEQDLHCLGRIGDGIDWFCNHAKGLSRVQNTVFTRVGYEAHHDVDDGKLSQLQSAIKDAISKGCTWIDVASPSQRSAVDDFFNSLEPNQRRRYQAFELPADVPIVQCMILKYADGRQSVLYGWSFASAHNKSDVVFHSDGEAAVAFFSNYLDALVEKSQSILSPSDAQKIKPEKFPVLRS